MEIKTKYNIGDKVNIQDNVTTRVVCATCEGKGIVTIKNKDFVCPNCDGNKKLDVKTKKSMMVEVTDIIIHVHNNEKTIKYVSDHSDWDARDYHIFYEKPLDK